ncbi:hypothetical protein ZEAMMB73_Zm00001d013050 [Zea mays]|uniref:Uncharacterized protein n=1 Tax=Zea mays TaxID=4577 RepID=A0A1D6GFB3_MAIZE|nr:hypothetical protein ZEAMMB73_Zm00001d013050 [Zea mays]
MPLRHVRRVYRIDGPRPRPSAWYEVKNDLLPGLRMIGAVPFPIPSSFSIRLVDDCGGKNRRLLNTEKIIFKAEAAARFMFSSPCSLRAYVVVKPNVPERELALYNIG